MRSRISCRGVVDGPPKYIVIDRSIWWGLYLNNKHLDLTQSYSIKQWDKKGIFFINDFLINNKLGSWDELSKKLGIPNSQKKTYNLLSKVINKEKIGKIMNNDKYGRFVSWDDGTPLKDSSKNRFMDCLRMINLCLFG